MYEIRYEKEAIGDIASLTASTKSKIKKAIETKLVDSPEVFGKPLRHSLTGFRSLRVGSYRVVYLIDKKIVRVLLIAHREDVYKIASKRIYRRN